MKKTYKFIAIGILFLVIGIVNYAVMNPINQQQHDTFKGMLTQYGYQGNPNDYESLENAYAHGLNFNYEWKNVYDAYTMTLTEIYVVSFICVAVAIVCFTIAVYYMQKRYKASKIEAYT